MMQAGKNPEPRKVFDKIEDFNYQIEEYISLPKTQTSSTLLFFEVINSRKSERIFNKLSLDQISNLLWHSAKAKKIVVSETGNILSHRASPSAGSIHPIDILISLADSLEQRTLLYYDPFSHRLAKLKLNITEQRLFLNNVNDCLPINNATLIWFVAHLARTEAKYKNVESLVWRDAGALTMTMQLVATAFNIRSCPVGTLGEPFLSKSFNNHLVSAGGLLLG